MREADKIHVYMCTCIYIQLSSRQKKSAEHKACRVNKSTFRSCVQPVLTTINYYLRHTNMSKQLQHKRFISCSHMNKHGYSLSRP